MQWHLPVDELLLWVHFARFNEIDSGSKVYLNTHQRSQGMHHRDYHPHQLENPLRTVYETFVSYVYSVVFLVGGSRPQRR